MATKKRSRYIIGVDSAGGGCDGDYAVAEVIDQESGVQCVELREHLTPRELAIDVDRLGSEYNEGLMVFRDGKRVQLRRATKREMADRILDLVLPKLKPKQ